MELQDLLGSVPVAQFISDFFQRLPYSARGVQNVADLATWSSLTGMLASETADVLICKRGQPYEGTPPPDEAAAKQLIDQGYTLLIRHAERHDVRLAGVAAAFARDFASEINIHLYCTPAAQFGFDWHYDAEDVFIVQTVGSKQYALRKNTVNPWPLEETLPRNMQYEREIMPLWRCELAAGSWLYIPSGYWHRAEAREFSISLAIGVQPHAAIEVLDRLRHDLLGSLEWRQRLPVMGAASPRAEEELQAQLASLFQRLGQDLNKRLNDPNFIAAYLRPVNYQPPSGTGA